MRSWSVMMDMSCQCISHSGSCSNYHSCLQICWCCLNKSTFVWQPTRFKRALMPLTDVVQGTTHHCHFPRNHWVGDFTWAIHYAPSAFQPAKSLLHHSPRPNETVVKATLVVGHGTCVVIAFHTGRVQGEC